MVSIPTILQKWTKRNDFLKAQIQVIVILAIARFGDKWVRSYPRNDNHNPHMFWLMNGLLALVALLTLKRDDDDGSVGASVVVASSLNNADGGTSSKVMEAAAATAAAAGSMAGVPSSPSSSTPPTPTPPISTTTNKKKVIPLSRSQTEEWKGWMQWAFVFYHYYRVYYVYNEIRVFVSAYVWMTGFGNYLYFTKKRDFSLERVVSMWLRINYFPLLLSYVVGVELELYYVVPLHTVGFFVTMGTCYVQDLLKERWGMSLTKAGLLAVGLSLVIHVVFYETPLVNTLLHISKEYHFRFRSDKYSAWVGIVSGYGWSRVTDYMQWAYGGVGGDEGNATTGLLRQRLIVPWVQRFVGLLLILTWYFTYGHIQDKYTYNPIHPYIFFLPVFGYLLLRNSSRYLTLLHSPALEFFGKITLETYVLQFHVFMCKKVQHIPVIIPGSGPDGPWYLKFGNMLLCGVGFVALAYWARKVTVMTQISVTDLVKEIRSGGGSGGGGGAQRRLMHGHTSDLQLTKTGGGSGDEEEEEERESFLPTNNNNSQDTNGGGAENGGGGGHLGKRGGGVGVGGLLETKTMMMMEEEVEMTTTQIMTNPDGAV